VLGIIRIGNKGGAVVSDKQILRDLMTKLTVPLWPTAGRALGFGRSKTYEMAKTGEIETIGDGPGKRPVPTAFLRRKLGIDGNPSTAA
jgi:hypothetical protein